MNEEHPSASNHSTSARRPRIALMWRGDWREPHRPTHYEARLEPVFAALRLADMEAEAIVYFDEDADAIRRRLRDFDGVLVWINPLADGRDRSIVDAILRDASANGVWVSAHPDVILKMGTKEVLYSTRRLGWALDTVLYESLERFNADFHARLAMTGPRVLKPNRGNDGQGVLKVEAVGEVFRVQFASDDRVELLRPEELARLLQPMFEHNGCVIDQRFNGNASAGMVRCYMSQNRVLGFAKQKPRIEAGGSATPPLGMNSSKAMMGPDAPAMIDLRARMEEEWVPGMQALLGLDTERLPVLWDADFLVRPVSDQAQFGRYALCEINVSCVSPFPDSAPPIVAQSTRRCVLAAMQAR